MDYSTEVVGGAGNDMYNDNTATIWTNRKMKQRLNEGLSAGKTIDINQCI